MKKRIKNIIMMLMLFCSLSMAAIEPMDFNMKPEVILDNFKIKDFDKINQSLLSPPSTDFIRKEHDDKSINYFFSAINQHFGDLVSYSASKKLKPYNEIGLAKGRVDFWDKHNKFIRYVYNVSFTKEADVYLMIYYVYFDKRLHFSKIGIATPKYDQDKQERFKQLTKDLKAWSESNKPLITPLSNKRAVDDSWIYSDTEGSGSGPNKQEGINERYWGDKL